MGEDVLDAVRTGPRGWPACIHGALSSDDLAEREEHLYPDNHVTTPAYGPVRAGPGHTLIKSFLGAIVGNESENHMYAL